MIGQLVAFLNYFEMAWCHEDAVASNLVLHFGEIMVSKFTLLFQTLLWLGHSNINITSI